jgi:hypothetical protein
MNQKRATKKEKLILLAKGSLAFWLRHQTFIFALLLIISVGLGGYIWFQSMYQSAWSDERKQEFLRTQDADIRLKGAEMEKVLSEMKRREGMMESPNDDIRNIFSN